MKLISSVIHNRLKNPSQTAGRLECDSTKDYIKKYVTPITDVNLVNKYADAYNTYSAQGLPPGPICNPGAAAIKAALYPSNTKYYYFCHDKFGNIYMARTKSEHDAMCSRLSARTESQGAGKTLAPLSMKRSAAMDIIRPEVLAPAGDAERLKAAVYYGADAVYMGGTRFGMRAAPKNFSDDELARAVSFAHENGVKVYLTCNIIPNTAQLKELPEFLEAASAAGVDALIITDLGVLSYAKKYASKVPIHISTQTGVANAESARMLFDLGAERVVSARELTLDELADLRAGMPKEMELECFVHGAMCVSYSGRCLLSNYLTDRHSNKGECSQPCRWEYSLMERTRQGEYFPVEETASGTYIMNSKDMCMIEHIPELIESGVSSFKIEGRAKTEYYTAVVTNAYRSAVDAYLAAPSNDLNPHSDGGRSL